MNKQKKTYDFLVKEMVRACKEDPTGWRIENYSAKYGNIEICIDKKSIFYLTFWHPWLKNVRTFWGSRRLKKVLDNLEGELMMERARMVLKDNGIKEEYGK